MSTEQLTPSSVAELVELKGQVLGPTPWLPITQELIDGFADVTKDFQWIHVNPETAKSTPTGTTIAHGLLTLSLGPMFMEQLMAFDGFAYSLNYGYDRIRFPAPVPSGSRLRMRATITKVEPLDGPGAQITTEQAFESDASEKPVCVAMSLARFYEQPSSDSSGQE
jgi:acyl dehydratase